MQHSRHLAFVFLKPPYGRSLAADGLDMLLATAAFDQKITAIFLGSGLFNLLPGQSHDINMKNQTKAFASLPLFDVANVLVDEREIQRYGLNVEQFLLPVTAVSLASVREHLHAADHVHSF
ncbi:sulfurtransferase complex subunit TusC [Allohahella sp. A8]|uniref:sulfurtransferase complex subunit TusC n=1 Tax=Allohahella sp. A8 TaxID=3141461 RepID=UPI003A813069